MRIRLNGKQTEVPAGTTVSDVVASVFPDPSRVAVERNREVVPRATWAAAPVAEGDAIEVVTLVGGG